MGEVLPIDRSRYGTPMAVGYCYHREESCHADWHKIMCSYSVKTQYINTTKQYDKHPIAYPHVREQFCESFFTVIILLWFIWLCESWLWYNSISLWCVHIQRSEHNSGLIVGLCPANERQWYFVMTPLIGWVQAQNQSCNFPPPPRIGHADLNQAMGVCITH